MKGHLNPKRIKAYHHGLRAESLVRDHLEQAGFLTLAQRYKTAGGEIDLIMKRADLICFVEVKARSSVKEGLESISEKAQYRLKNAAQHWLNEYCAMGNTITNCRFDLAIVTPDESITLIENALMS